MSRAHLPHWPKKLPHDLTGPATNLVYNAAVSAARYPHKPYVIFFDAPLTYAELKQQSEQLAGFLQQACGVAKGDRVVLPFFHVTIAPTHINPVDRPKRPCLGVPIFNPDSRVIDPETFQALPPGPEHIGEIVTRGPQVFQGYWRNEAATLAAFIELDGKKFLRTGDLGYVDAEGYFFLVDRLKRMINASGYKVWPAEVEAQMYQHPAVQEACVVAAKDAHRRETVKAFVVLRAAFKDQVSESDIIDWTRQHMATYKHPRIVEFVDALPKSATGKVQWRTLQEAERARA